MSTEFEERPPEELRELLRDSNYLPTTQEVLAAFPEDDRESRSKVNVDWQYFKGEERIYQLLTREMIESLATEIIERANALIKERQTSTPLVLLEIGAGDGRLSRFLREEFEKRGLQHAIEIVATDSGVWMKDGRVKSQASEIVKLPYKKALERYADRDHLLILSSWMPPGRNWMPDITRQHNVDGCFLIGDIDSTGKGRQTWNPDENDGFETHWITDKIQGNISVAQPSPRIYSHGKSQFAYRERMKEE